MVGDSRAGKAKRDDSQRLLASSHGRACCHLPVGPGRTGTTGTAIMFPGQEVDVDSFPKRRKVSPKLRASPVAQVMLSMWAASISNANLLSL